MVPLLKKVPMVSLRSLHPHIRNKLINLLGFMLCSSFVFSNVQRFKCLKRKHGTRHHKLIHQSGREPCVFMPDLFMCVHETWSCINVKRVLDSRDPRCSSPPPSLNPETEGLGLHRNSEETDLGNFFSQFKCNQEQSLELPVCVQHVFVCRCVFSRIRWSVDMDLVLIRERR